MVDDAKRSLLDAAFFGSSVDHFNQETGSTILSLAEQIGRTVALLEVVSGRVSQSALRGVLGQLEALLTAETAAALGRIKPAPPIRSDAPPIIAKPAVRYPISLQVEAPITPEEQARAPVFFMYEPVVFTDPGSGMESLEQPGKVIGVLYRKSGWVLDIKNGRKGLVRVAAKHVRRLEEGAGSRPQDEKATPHGP